MNTEESEDNITTVESTAVKQKVKEENVKTENPLLVTIQSGNICTVDPLLVTIQPGNIGTVDPLLVTIQPGNKEENV